jgi:hypothetical protein
MVEKRVERKPIPTGENEEKPHHDKSKKKHDAFEKVVYKASKHTASEHVPEYHIFCIDGMTEKYRKDKTIALADVVQSFKVFVNGTESPSKAQLLDTFGSSNDTDVVMQILEKGEIRGEGKGLKKNQASG